MLLDSLSAAGSATRAWTFHLSLFMQFPSAHSFSLLSTCQVAALPSSILTAPLSGITHKLSEAEFHPFDKCVTQSQFQHQYCGAT